MNQIEYISTAEWAAKNKIDSRRARGLCQQGLVKGVKKIGRAWVIPQNAKNPIRAIGRPKKASELF